MKLERESPCKVNLLLNILGRRADGFHELETVMHPMRVYDRLTLETAPGGIHLTCNHPELPTDSRNLVHRAAEGFLQASGVQAGIRIHLAKRMPLAAGLGGGSGNAATTLVAMNELFGKPLGEGQMQEIAAGLGSDTPFFLQPKPALATGRGERITTLDWFPALAGKAFFLVHPGFGIATAWAYQQLARFPAALNGTPGRAERLVERLQGAAFESAASELYNSLEAPALEKYPVLGLYQQFLRARGAVATLMSGSGSTTFALFPGVAEAQAAVGPFQERFGSQGWITVVPA